MRKKTIRKNTANTETPSLSLDPTTHPISLDGIRATFTKPVTISPPPAGPAWFGAVMGTGIISTLSVAHIDWWPFCKYLSVGFLIIGWLILIGLTAGFCYRIIKDRTAITNSIFDFTQAPMWGMVAMGYLAIGSATSTTGPLWWPQYSHTFWVVDGLLWTIGTILGIITALGFGGILINRPVGTPTPVWGLPLVPPMVSATTGAAIIPHCPTPGTMLWLVVVVVGCFFLALNLGLIVFTVAYHHAWRKAKLPLVASAAAWIPLGIVGQSTAAAQAMAEQTVKLSIFQVHNAIFALAHLYGYIMLSIGIPLFGWALYRSVTGLANRMPFTSGWWAMTFPVGTCSLGTHLLGQSTNLYMLSLVGFILYLFLICTWHICAFSSLFTLLRHYYSNKITTDA